MKKGMTQYTPYSVAGGNDSMLISGSNSTLTMFDGSYYSMVGNCSQQSTLDPSDSANLVQNIAVIIPVASVWQGFFVEAVSAPGGVDTFTFTIYKNGVATGITCTITGSDIVASDTTHSMICVAGDLISLRFNTTLSSALRKFTWGLKGI